MTNFEIKGKPENSDYRIVFEGTAPIPIYVSGVRKYPKGQTQGYAFYAVKSSVAQGPIEQVGLIDHIVSYRGTASLDQLIQLFDETASVLNEGNEFFRRTVLGIYVADEVNFFETINRRDPNKTIIAAIGMDYVMLDPVAFPNEASSVELLRGRTITNFPVSFTDYLLAFDWKGISGQHVRLLRQIGSLDEVRLLIKLRNNPT